MMNSVKRLLRGWLVAGMMLCATVASAQDTIKIGYVDPFSGAFAANGDSYLKMLTYALNRTNAAGGALGKKFELVTFDDKLQPAEALIALKSITDQNMPFVLQCIGSNVAAAMIEGVARHNARNPNNRVLFLNCSALATELTEDKCDFWHFRFAGNVTQRVAALVRGLPKDMSTVYVINQDYLYGQGVAADTKKFLAEYRPEVKVVGEDLVPLGKVKDFSPYVAKIKASGAKGVITSNWGPDFNQLIKAGNDSGLDVQYYTFAAHLVGGPTAVGEGGLNRVIAVTEGHDNIGAENGIAKAEDFVKGWRATDPGFDYPWINFQTMFDMLAAAINKAGSTDPLKVAVALENIQTTDIYGRPAVMRGTDHQLQSPFYTALLTKPVKNDSERTGLGWKTQSMSTMEQLTFPTSCKMKRPSGS